MLGLWVYGSDKSDASLALLPPSLASAIRFAEQSFAETYGTRSDFDQLVLLDVLQTILQRHFTHGSYLRGRILAGRADVCKFLPFYHVDDQITCLAVFADNLACVDRIARLNEEKLRKAILYPTIGLLWEAEVEDPELATAYTRSYNRWIVDMCKDGSGRLYPIAHISLADV